MSQASENSWRGEGGQRGWDWAGGGGGARRWHYHAGGSVELYAIAAGMRGSKHQIIASVNESEGSKQERVSADLLHT